MVNLIRRFQKPLLTAVVILVILSFVVFFNMQNARGGLDHADAVARIYGRNVSRLETQREGYRFQVCMELQMGELLFALAGRDAAMAMMFGQQLDDSAVDNFIWNTLVLRHEAEALGITATEAEIEQGIKAIRPFQTNGAFNPQTYGMYIENRLSHRGLSAKDLESVVADQIKLEKVRTLLGTTVAPSPAEVRDEYVQRNQKTEASFFRLKLDEFKAAAQVTDEDVAKTFEERKAGLKTPEKRKVKYVAFSLPSGKPLAGAERSRATEELSKQAANFAIEMTAPRANFDSAAGKLGLPVKETPFFARDDAPAELAKSDAAAEAAFRLTKEQPNSDAVIADNGYYVLQLAETEESRPLTINEAKPQITQQLKDDRAHEAMNLKATELRAAIDKELKAGKPIDEAAKTAGVTLEKIPPFSPTDRGQDAPEISTAKRQTAEMKEGELSELVPISSGGIVVYLDRHLPIDEASFQKDKAQVTESLTRMKGQAVFLDWLKERRDAAKLESATRRA